MFTGLIEAVGSIRELNAVGEDVQITVVAELDFNELEVGASIAVNGACLTATRLNANSFDADVSQETLRCTTLGLLKAGSAVNLERSLTLQKPLGGHLVSGHVDGLARIRCVTNEARSVQYTLEVPGHLAKYIAIKGSVCLDGISLTVNHVEQNQFSVNLIPHTQLCTTAQHWRVDQTLNLEVDLIARYLERLYQGDQTQGSVSMQTLIDNGFSS